MKLALAGLLAFCALNAAVLSGAAGGLAPDASTTKPASAAKPAPAPGAITWASRIAPILYTNCTTCHHPGGAGPFSLLTYRDAVRWGTQVATVTQSHYMPPWLPEHQWGAFADERRLTPDEIGAIDRWVKAAMPEGDPAKSPAPPVYRPEWQYGTPDLILKVDHPFTLPAGGTDVFRNFVLPYPLAVSHTIRAVEIRPGAPAIVHHANILIDRTASFRRQHPDDWQQGVPGMEVEIDAGNTFDPDAHFLFWKPDSPVLVEPKGMEWRLDPGNDLVLNMHLKPSGKAEVVSAEIGLYFTDDMPARQPMLLQLEHDRALDLPPGVRDFAVDDLLRLPVDVELLGIYPHAHYLGKRLEAWATLPGGRREPLITIPDWDIDRQAVYRYRRPMLLPAGTVVQMHYLYDNSAANVHNPHLPPIRVKAGNRSEDEMAHLWLQVLPVHTPPGAPDPRLLLEEAWMRNRLSKEPDDAIARYNLAAALAGQGIYKDAIAQYGQLLAAHPNEARTLNSLGATLESSGDWRAARTTYAEAIAAHPETCDARFNLARLDLRHEQAAEAEQQLRAMLTQCPIDAAVHSGLGVALTDENRPQEASAEFQAALAIDPHDYTALYNLGAQALAAGELGRATQLLSQAVEQQPTDPDARRQLAATYAQSGRMTDAIAQLREGVRLAPEDAELHASLSQALATTGALREAIAEQQTALRLNANDADGWNNLGVLEARSGVAAEAREAFHRALRIEPGHAQARANLDRLPPG
jgi:Flp pilus assembly protein TadD/mono/diheme cytochrome c family protein